MSHLNLLSIVELGGYPNFTQLYVNEGYQVEIVPSVRKALQYLKKTTPQVIIAEFNFQSDFRDRTSSLESLLAVVQRNPEVKVIVFYEKEYEPQLQKLWQAMPLFESLSFPIENKLLRTKIKVD